MERERLLEELCGKAAELVLEHNMRHEEVAKAIRDHLLHRAEALPKLPVLYNGCYGGFGLSKEFKAFRAGKEVQGYDAILEFGRHLQERHPEVYRVLYLVEVLGLKRLVSDLCHLYDTERDLEWTQQQLEGLTLSAGNGKMDEMSNQQFYRSKSKLSSLDCSVLSTTGKSSLKERLDESVGFLSQQLDWQKQKQLDGSEVLRSDVAHWAETTFHERRGSGRAALGSTEETNTLMQILNDTPEHWPACEIFQKENWKLAIKYAKSLVDFPENKVHSIVNLEDESAHDKTVWVLGSRGASGEYADLKVTWVPQLVKYTIYDYDGLQSVRW